MQLSHPDNHRVSRSCPDLLIQVVDHADFEAAMLAVQILNDESVLPTSAPKAQEAERQALPAVSSTQQSPDQTCALSQAVQNILICCDGCYSRKLHLYSPGEIKWHRILEFTRAGSIRIDFFA